MHCGHLQIASFQKPGRLYTVLLTTEVFGKIVSTLAISLEEMVLRSQGKMLWFLPQPSLTEFTLHLHPSQESIHPCCHVPAQGLCAPVTGRLALHHFPGGWQCCDRQWHFPSSVLEQAFVPIIVYNIDNNYAKYCHYNNHLKDQSQRRLRSHISIFWT